MKLLFSCFMIPVYIALGIAGLGGLFIFLDSCGCRPAENPHSFLSNLYFCVLHFSMAVSLGLSVLTMLCSVCMAAVGFILKIRIGALTALACAAASGFLAYFLMNTVL